MSETLERLTVENASADEIMRAAIAEGMLTLRDDGFAKVQAGADLHRGDSPSRRVACAARAAACAFPQVCCVGLPFVRVWNLSLADGSACARLRARRVAVDNGSFGGVFSHERQRVRRLLHRRCRRGRVPPRGEGVISVPLVVPEPAAAQPRPNRRATGARSVRRPACAGPHRTAAAAPAPVRLDAGARRRPRVTREQRLVLTLDRLMEENQEIEAAALVSLDGFTMASALPEGMQEDRVGAMSAAILGLGRACRDRTGPRSPLAGLHRG